MRSRTLLAAAALLPILAACDPGDPQPVDRVEDTVAAPVGQMSAATVGQTVDGYVTAAAMGDMYEIAAAEIALQRSQTPAVRELATMLRDDHTAASQRMQTLVPQAAPQAQVPTELDQRREGLLENLRTAPATNFDDVFMSQQVAAHEEALTLHRGFADTTEAPALAEHARTVVPRLEAHLEMARRGTGPAT